MRWAQVGTVPASSARAVRERARVPSPERVAELERTTNHDVAAFVDAVSSELGPEGRWFHYGLTSSDVLDTALALTVQDAGALIRDGIDRAFEAVVARAQEHRDTITIGRTHGVHAEPTTFGLKLLGWAFELERDRGRLDHALAGMRVGKLSGAVGTYATTTPDVERIACEALGLEPAPSSTQILQRDRHAELLTALSILASSLDRFALEIRHLARTEVREVEEPFAAGQKGSSAMPHKRNPIVSERICGLARLVRGYALVGLENVALWHERDISHSSNERVVLPDAFLAVDYMLDRFAWLVEGPRHPARTDACESRGDGRSLLQSTAPARSRAVRTGARRRVPDGAASRDACVGRGARLSRARPCRSGDRGARRSRRRVRSPRVHRDTSTSSSIACAPNRCTRRSKRERWSAHRKREGPRDLRGRRRHARPRRERSDLDLRRRPADADPGQGSRAHRAVGVLVRANAPHRPEPSARDSRRRSHDDLPPPRDAPDRVRRARVPRRLGLEGLSRDRGGVRARRCPTASPSPRACPSRSSRRRRRRARATTRTSTRGARGRSAARSAYLAAKEAALALYRFGAAHAEARGIILADTKFEFGVARDGTVVLADEALTPDSSRFWPASAYQPGGPQPSFDKQFVRDWCERTGWNKEAPGPELPDDVVAGTRSRYVEAFERLTEIPFDDYVARPEVVL